MLDAPRPRRTAGAAFLRAALAAVVVLIAACSPASSPNTTSPAALSPGSPSSSTTASSPAASATSSPEDRLAAAFAAMDGGYTYTATVTVGTTAVSTAKGRSVGGKSEFELTANGSSVTYRAIPPKAWVKQAGKAWVAVSGKVPAGSPIAALQSPTSMSVVSDDANGLTVDATFPPAALGLTGTDPTPVRLVVAPDGTVTAMYQTTVGSDAAASTSVFTPKSGLSPIAAPST